MALTKDQVLAAAGPELDHMQDETPRGGAQPQTACGLPAYTVLRRGDWIFHPAGRVGVFCDLHQLEHRRNRGRHPRHEPDFPCPQSGYGGGGPSHGPGFLGAGAGGRSISARSRTPISARPSRRPGLKMCSLAHVGTRRFRSLTLWSRGAQKDRMANGGMVNRRLGLKGCRSVEHGSYAWSCPDGGPLARSSCATTDMQIVFKNRLEWTGLHWSTASSTMCLKSSPPIKLRRVRY